MFFMFFFHLQINVLTSMCSYTCASQRLWKLTQPTDDWLPADHDARLTTNQQRQQPMTSMMTSRGVVADTVNTPVGLVAFRARPGDDVMDHVTADKDGGRVNRAFESREDSAYL